ncbi:MAG: LacI family DNA-binding transcriptional regulator [Capsulimonadales bacterium]|nr:LacI family DNA-binding transcriptional regulator [Capsulimonadales bacterium]
MTTIRDVAKACGVSTATVSNVLNSSGRPVHPRTRARVLETARHLNYHPSTIARVMTGQRVHTIGVLFGVLEPEVITNPYASAILNGIFSTAAEREYNVTLWTAPWRSAAESAGRFRDRRADGFIIVGAPLNSDIISGLADMGVPVVSVSSQTVPEGVPFVDVDNEKGLRLATEYVIGLGHTRIAHMTGDIHQPSMPARQEGFLKAMAAAGLPVPPEYLVTSWYIVGRSKPDAHRLLTMPNRPTAIVTASDNIACAILEVARELEIAVPEELSVTGFDDIPPATLVTPQLTTIRQPLVEIGKTATNMLLQIIEDSEDVPSMVVEPTLIVRDSTGPPRK